MNIKIYKKNKHGTHCIILDIKGFELFCKYRWHIHKGRSSFYICRNISIDGNGSMIQFHRELTNTNERAIVVDHINGNGLDNRIENLRRCSNKENIRNSGKKIKNALSMFKGVTYRKNRKTFQAQIRVDRKYIYLGCFKKEVDAAIAYNAASIKYFGKFAKINLF